jgi:hypothetical protein
MSEDDMKRRLIHEATPDADMNPRCHPPKDLVQGFPGI